MAYFTPYIDNSGIHVPTYRDIIDYYIAKAKEINTCLFIPLEKLCKDFFKGNLNVFK